MMKYDVITYKIMTYYVMSYDIMTYDLMTYDAMAYDLMTYVVRTYDTMIYYIITYDVISYDVMTPHFEDCAWPELTQTQLYLFLPSSAASCSPSWLSFSCILNFTPLPPPTHPQPDKKRSNLSQLLGHRWG